MNVLTKERETRAALIERENSDPEIKAQKEQLIEQLIAKWEQWGIIKLTGTKS